MKINLAVVLLALCTFTGCLTALQPRLYPAKGPLAAQVPTPVFAGRIALRQNGNISLTLANGEIATGRWEELGSAKERSTRAASDPQLNDPQFNDPQLNREMASLWDSIYGQGFYGWKVLGSQLYARATVSGNKGTLLYVEFFRNVEQRYRTTCFYLSGVAKDNNGNIYKLTL